MVIWICARPADQEACVKRDLWSTKSGVLQHRPGCRGIGPLGILSRPLQIQMLGGVGPRPGQPVFRPAFSRGKQGAWCRCTQLGQTRCAQIGAEMAAIDRGGEIQVAGRGTPIQDQMTG